MSNRAEVGIDVSKEVLDVAVRREGEQRETARFYNEAGGHGKLVRRRLSDPDRTSISI